MSALWESPFFGVTLTILAYWAGCKIQKRTGLVICNGLVLAVMMIIAVLAVFDIPYAAYNAGGSLINLFLGPATVCLAVTIYAQIDLLKKNLLPILAGCAAGAVTSVLSIWGLCRLFGLDRTLTVSLLPKSVTTPIATAIAEGQGGIVSITVAAVIFMPATLIASIYGMNFKFMPELDWTLTLGNGWNIPLGYIFAIGLMIFCSALTIWYFKYKKWL